MTDPVVASDGFTYERVSIVLWMKTNTKSPINGAELDRNMLIPNNAIRTQIAEWRRQNGVPYPDAELPTQPQSKQQTQPWRCPLL